MIEIDILPAPTPTPTSPPPCPTTPSLVCNFPSLPSSASRCPLIENERILTLGRARRACDASGHALAHKEKGVG